MWLGGVNGRLRRFWGAWYPVSSMCSLPMSVTISMISGARVLINVVPLHNSQPLTISHLSNHWTHHTLHSTVVVVHALSLLHFLLHQCFSILSALEPHENVCDCLKRCHSQFNCILLWLYQFVSSACSYRTVCNASLRRYILINTAVECPESNPEWPHRTWRRQRLICLGYPSL